MPWVANRNDGEQSIVKDVLAKYAGAEFGEECYVAAEARIFTTRLRLGSRSWIAAGAIVRGRVTIGDDSTVNPYAHIAGTVVIGSGVRIGSLASIYGFNHGFAKTSVPMFRQKQSSLGVTIGDDVWIGANAVILDGAKVGAHSIVAAGAVVTKEFPEYSVIGGNPARVLKHRNSSNQD